jgi:hypothetical protein
MTFNVTNPIAGSNDNYHHISANQPAGFPAWIAPLFRFPNESEGPSNLARLPIRPSTTLQAADGRRI